jgi:exopolysaccharide production protein ExoQ
MEATVSDPESEHLSRRPPRLAWWPAVLPLLLMLISDDKLRLRPPEESIAGQADRTVVVEIAVYVCVAIYLYLRFGLRPPRRRATILTVLAWLFAGYAALSALWSPYPGPAVVRAAQLLITASLAHVIATRARVEELHRFAHAFVVAVLLSVGIGVVHPFRRLPLMQDRFNWLYVHQVVVGIYLAIAVLVVTAYLTRRGDQTRARLWSTGTYVVILAILVSALIATGTRGAAVGCAAGLVVMLATSRGPRGRAEMIIMAIPVAVIVVLSLSDKILAFMTRGETAEQRGPSCGPLPWTPSMIARYLDGGCRQRVGFSTTRSVWAAATMPLSMSWSTGDLSDCSSSSCCCSSSPFNLLRGRGYGKHVPTRACFSAL